MDAALEALEESGEKVDRYVIEAEIAEISRLDGDAATRAAANARIVNGLPTVLFPAVGSVLWGHDPTRAKQLCTGTLIGSRHVLTAAHCIQRELDAASYHVFFQNAGLFAVEKLFWQEIKYSFPNADLAIMRLRKPVSGVRPMELGLVKEPPIGTRSTIIGFGNSGGSRRDYGIKRIGSVKLSKCTATGYDDVDLLCWKYAALSNVPGEDSNTCEADSGGPMLWNLSLTRWVVVGVTSGGTQENCLSGDIGIDVSVFAHKAWIASVVDTDLGQAADVPPAVGDEGTCVLAQDGHLSKSNTNAAWKFSVTEDAREVRIAFNGEDDGKYTHNFDLEVSFIEDDGARQPLCQVTEQSQFGACRFEDPRPGIWETSLSHKDGGGFFQVVATLFNERAGNDPKF